MKTLPCREPPWKRRLLCKAHSTRLSAAESGAPLYKGRHPGPVYDPGFKSLGEDHAMRCRTGLKAAALGLLGASALATAALAQEGAGAAKPWRGAGPTPCYG